MSSEESTEPVPASRAQRLWELAGLFLKLGVIGFGGPAAHIALMEQECVRRRCWLSHEEFLDMVGATNLIPGPNSTELAIHIGRLRAGGVGLVVAGACFILPAMLLVMGCGWLYVTYGQLPQVNALLYGVKPVIIAIVLQALWNLGQSAVKSLGLALIGGATVLGNLLGMDELALLFGAALVAMVGRHVSRSRLHAVAAVPLTPVAWGAAAPFGLWPMFLFFLKVGAVLFGSGYVLLAFLRADLVDRWHWLTDAQLFDAIAVGQVTPGPVFTTATFIGYILGGVPGSLLATLGIFLPAFVFVAVSAPLLRRLRASPTMGAFLDGLNVASLALMVVVTWQLGRSAVVDVVTVVIALVAAVLLFRFRVNSMWLVLGGAILGWAVKS
ncbi:chromate transporter, chromate ion transporter (CHR) family [Chthoniobacter flavus Ellin428]|uniref:Chromate transporter, chromate ion transporter (CHR) family n=1 Tax=Chthoniobacter flavus Ellin428 TaxID=497964 RepID=B4D986_9BACT|nr:chromate efflux transporter [Chthoniobacter flavus]EDY16989.1 chromate transporter, chromate ion transporter (CHR) family [Chthoniobacter flavus Ellin428]TCO86075.1 chromate transporter [Chthoniobacter flavus]